MAYTTDQYNKLKEAIALGALEVDYGDKKVKFRTLEEMYDIKDKMEAELGLKKRKSKFIKTSFTKGT